MIALIAVCILLAVPVTESVRPQVKLSVTNDGHFIGSSNRTPDNTTAKEFKDPAGGFNAKEAASYWGNDATKEVSPCIANEINTFVHAEGYTSIADYGAGLGGFGMYMKGKGIAEVHCYDANPLVKETSKGLCQVVNLGELQPKLPKVDVVMTLEVGEHIPKEFEQNFLDNLASASTKAIVVSWAHPGQGGTRHVNEQTQTYVADQIRQRGFGLDRTWTSALRIGARDCPQHPYFVTNPMVFKKRDASEGSRYEAWSDWFWLNKRLFIDVCWLATDKNMYRILGHNVYRMSLFFPLLLVFVLGSVGIGLYWYRTKSAAKPDC